MSSSTSKLIKALRTAASLLGLESSARATYHRLTRVPVQPMASETSKCRTRLSKWCTGYGVDLGFGGDPITPAAIRMDMKTPYANYLGIHPVQLGGDVTDLYWFRDGVLDFVYSSHVLEDFEDTDSVLKEWLRVLRPSGHLVIYCPDEQVYRKYCESSGHPYNTHHVHENFSLDFVQKSLARVGGTREIHSSPLVEEYSWELVVQKIAASS